MLEKPIDITPLCEDYGDSDLNALKAIVIYVGYLIARVATMTLTSFVLETILVHRHTERLDDLSVHEATDLVPPELGMLSSSLGDVVSAIIVILMSVYLAKQSLRKRRTVDAAWVMGRPADLLQGAILGIIAYIVAIIAGILLSINNNPPSNSFVSEQLSLHDSIGLPLIVTANAFSFIASNPIEEMLCRGIVFGGFAKSFGKSTAAIVSTCLFVLIHFPVNSFSDIVTPIVLSVFALHLRMKSKAIGPSIVLHLSYNFISLFLLTVGMLMME
mgnify:CR=1 FL=1